MYFSPINVMPLEICPSIIKSGRGGTLDFGGAYYVFLWIIQFKLRRDD